MTPGPEDRAEVEGEPIVRDKRRIDPETGELREAGASAAVGEVPDGGASPDESGPEDPTAGSDEVADLTDQLARAKADNYNLDQRFNAYVRRSRAEVTEARARGREDVVEALVGVLDDIELSRQHGELTGPFASIAEKLEGILEGTFGVERYGAPGEDFDPGVHEALMHSQSEDATSETVQQVLQPGYRVGDRVIRPARVAVVGPQ
ncbi:nucleotide exchange factor GrpE [Pseudactinotalea suaedae]|uniref:nucleotide exchange factor GrpE n=1 Tax=Pseudactinotalea suaedae TaxID=1524924 RepID=UPI0012E12BEF|nr:nucleotide exchange factor GrpE [Pseudactinotalea suaedae]